METQNGMLLKDLVEEVGLQIVNRSTDFDKKLITTQVINRPGLQLTGFYEHFTTNRIQIIGINENAYLQNFTTEIRQQKFDDLMKSGIPALIIAHDVEMMPEYVSAAQKYDITLLKSQKETSEIMVAMMTRLNNAMAPKIMRHGVFVEVYGEGLLILGESGMGKSEAALELIKRGHRLISDDAVNIKKINSTTLMGTAPELIRNYIELRGIGVVDVRHIFGNGAVKMAEKIDLVVKLETWKQDANYDRLGNNTNYIDILGVKLPYLTVPITPGRNLAVILEVAAMNNRQKRMGYDSARDFTERLDQYFDALEEG
ncbi:MAG: HPr(Ser) kinase/phosphatase [Oscillospiraceae bacterium]